MTFGQFVSETYVFHHNCSNFEARHCFVFRLLLFPAVKKAPTGARGRWTVADAKAWISKMCQCRQNVGKCRPWFWNIGSGSCRKPVRADVRRMSAAVRAETTISIAFQSCTCESWNLFLG